MTNGPDDIDLSRLPDLDSLQLLLRVASAGSFGRAATAHGISQPAVSARIAAMESLVGFGLVERTNRGSVLTPRGALLADWAREILHAAAGLATSLASLRADQDARLQVAASLTIAEHLLPGWLVAFAADHPDTAVSLQAINSTAVEQAVLTGEVDLGFTENPVVGHDLDSSVVAVDQLAVVVSPTHPWARRRRPLTGDELAGTRLVHREPTSGTRTSLIAALAEHPTLAVPLMELSTATAVRAAVAAGAGPAVLSALAVKDDLMTTRLVRIPVTGIDLTRQLRAVWPRGRHPTGPAHDLLAVTTRARSSARTP